VGRLLKAKEMQAKLRSPHYLAALEDPLSGHIHPLNYTLGLAQAAQAAGAKLFTQSCVTKVEQGNTIKLHTAHGKVSAKFLLLSGGAYLGGLTPPIAGYIMPAGTYIIATEPRDDVAALIPATRRGRFETSC